MRAVLEIKPESNVQVRLFLKRDALSGNAALDFERHLERRGARIELFHDFFQCGGGREVKFTGVGCKSRFFHGVRKVFHCFLLSNIYLTEYG